jgi:copper chaperone CopZ
MKRLVALALLTFALWFPDALHGQTASPPQGDSLRLNVDGMVCSICAFGVERRLKRLDTVEDVHVNLDSGLVVVTLRPGGSVTDSTLADEVRRAGFSLRGVTRLRRGGRTGRQR